MKKTRFTETQIAKTLDELDGGGGREIYNGRKI
jgi:hypothetical protein